jgi:acetyltransferase-like isoleucine patch superfamily enzyme
VRIGARALIAAYTYFVGGDHLHDRVDIPILEQGRTARASTSATDVWLALHVVVTDGVRIGRDAIIGAGAIVRERRARLPCRRPGSMRARQRHHRIDRPVLIRAAADC